jgi:predicted porin
MKKVISLAIAAALAAPVAAMADATVYGKVRMSIDMSDVENIDMSEGTPPSAETDLDQIDISSHASRLGIKGSEDLGNGLKAVYKLEFGIDIAGKQSNEFKPDNPVSGRNAYVGLAGDFGTVLLGRHDTPLKMSTGKLDYFADTIADYNGGKISNDERGLGSVPSAGFSDRRADGTLAYVSPNFSGLTFAAALVPGENDKANGLADAYSLAAMYSNAGLYLAAAYESADDATDLLKGENVNPGDHDQWRLGAEYDFGQFKLAGVYESEELDNVAGGTYADYTKWNLSGAMKVGAAGMVKATYFDSEEDESEEEVTGFTIGYDHNFSKRTQIYALYNDSTTEEPGFEDLEVSIFSIGMNHQF